MAEQAVQAEVQQTPTPVVIVPQQELSAEDRMWAAANPSPERPRAPDGKFLPQNPQAQVAPESAEQPAQEAQTEQQTAEQPPAESEHIAWDEVKDVKVKIPMKVDGKEWEEEVTLEQLRSERMRQTDYTRKTQELAEHRRQIEQQVQQAAMQQRTQYVQALQAQQRALMETVAPELQGMTQERWTQLANDDPAAFVRLQNRVQQVNQAFGNIQQRIDMAQRQQAEQEQQITANAIQEAKQKIAESIPDWNDDLYQAVMKRGVETYGFSQQEMTSAYDDRFIRLMADAHKYRQMMEQKPAIEKKVQAVPPVLRPGNKPQQGNRGAELLKQAREQARSSKTLDSAADLFKAMGF